MTPEDEESLLAGIESIARDRAAYSQGRDYVARYFDRDVLALRLLDELAAMVAPTPATIPFPVPAVGRPASIESAQTAAEVAPERRAAA
jgi:hypothetical protein